MSDANSQRARVRRAFTVVGWALLIAGATAWLVAGCVTDKQGNWRDGAGLVFFLGACLCALGLAALGGSNFYERLPVSTSQAAMLPEDEFLRIVGEIERELPIIDDVDIPMRAGEHCHLGMSATLVTPTKQRVYVGGHLHRMYASVPIELRSNEFARGALYVTSNRVVFIASDNSVTESWTMKQVVDVSYVRTTEGCSGVTISTTLKRDAGKSFWFGGPQEAQIAAAVIRKAITCYA